MAACPARRCVGEVDGYLGVLDPPRGAGVLALDPDAVDALLQVTGLVDDQHGVLSPRDGRRRRP
jgi:hypothetical protein